MAFLDTMNWNKIIIFCQCLERYFLVRWCLFFCVTLHTQTKKYLSKHWQKLKILFQFIIVQENHYLKVKKYQKVRENFDNEWSKNFNNEIFSIKYQFLGSLIYQIQYRRINVNVAYSRFGGMAQCTQASRLYCTQSTMAGRCHGRCRDVHVPTRRGAQRWNGELE